jgi:hypothetical protein
MSDSPDRFTLGVRFGCGALFGLVLPFVGGSIFSFETGRSALGWCLLVALVCGLLAMRFGETFWEKVVHSRFWRWWM